MNKFFQYTFLTTMIIMIYLLMSVISPALFGNRVTASTIDENDVYRGLGIAALLLIVSHLGRSQDRNAAKKDELDDFKGDDRDLLAKIIYAEARGEPFNGQVAVGSVVLNRVESSDFPDSIKKVIYQDGQFSSLLDGQFYLTPNETSYRAADRALDGEDPSQGALYFYNPRTAKTLWWLTTRKKTTEIGDHVFAK